LLCSTSVTGAPSRASRNDSPTQRTASGQYGGGAVATDKSEGTTTSLPAERNSAATEAHVFGPTLGLCTSTNTESAMS